MTARMARSAAWSIVVVASIGVISTVVLWSISAEPTGGDGVFLGFVLILGLTFCAAGAVLIARLPQSPIGWLLAGIGLFQVANGLTSEYALVALLTHPGSLPWGDFANWASAWTWMPSVGLLTTFLVLLFPTGRPPTPRWRWVGWLAAIAITLDVVGTMIDAWPYRHDVDVLVNGDFQPSKGLPGLILLGVAVVASVVSLVVRFRRSSGDERQQLRWFTYTALVVAIGFVLSLPPGEPGLLVFAVGFLAIPLATGVAVLRYRLYDLDLVIKKALIALVLALLLAAIGLVVVLTAGQVALWRGTPRGISALVGIVIGILFVPLLRVSRRIANRLVYGRRATPYEVLSTFSARVAETYSIDDVLPRMAQVLAAGTGAASARVLLRVGSDLREVAAHGEPEGEEHLTPVIHQGEDLGALGVTFPANDPMDPQKERLVDDMAKQAGLVLRNVRLIEELKASRQRLVAAQDEERRKLERNIHDGAQQHLVALTVKQRLAASFVGKDDERARLMIEELQAQTNEALEDLRDLARGIYPPLLADKGLAAALEAQARKAAVPTVVDADSIERYDQDVEATVYFCALEALQNIAKYANATHATITLGRSNGALTFDVQDDGDGFDPGSTTYGTGLQGMADRLDAVGGSFAVTSAPGLGTTISGTVPADGSRA